MNSIRIGDRIWMLDQELGKITSGSNLDGLDLTLQNDIQNKNLQLLLDYRSSARLYTDKEGYLHRGSNCTKVKQTREAVRGAVEALQRRIQDLDDGQKFFANHFFYCLFRDSKINLYEKRIVSGKTIWQRRRAFVRDPFESHLDIKVGDLFWTVSRETGHISHPRSIVHRDEQTDCFDLTDELSDEGSHNLKMLLLRRKGEKLCVDEKGLLRKGSGNQEKVKRVVNLALAHAMHRADELKNRAETEIEQLHYRTDLFARAGGLLQRLEDLLEKIPDPGDWEMVQKRATDFYAVKDVEGLRDMSMRLSNRLDPLVEFLEDARRADLAKKAQDLSVALARLSIECRKLQESSVSLEEVAVKTKEKAQAALQLPAVSHFLYHFMNREGSIGRLSDQVGFVGKRHNRVFHHDLLEKHVDIVIGDQYWSINTKTGHISKALPKHERHVDVETIDLSSDDRSINKSLKALFERTPKTYFHVDDEGLLQRVQGLRGRFKYWRNKTEERKKVQTAVSAAIGHLDGKFSSSAGKLFLKVKNVESTENESELKELTEAQEAALKIFLRGKMQGDGPLARMQKEHYDRSVISENGGLEGVLKHGLQKARLALEEAKKLSSTYPPQKLQPIEIAEEDRLTVETITINLMRENAFFEKIVAVARHELNHLIDEEPRAHLKKQLKDRLAMMADWAARRHLRSQANQYKELLEVQNSNQVPNVLAQVNPVLEYVKRQIIRHSEANAQLELLFEEGLFAQSLGIGLVPLSGGSGNNWVIRNRSGDWILVAKPDDEGPYGRNNPKWGAYIKQLFLGVRSCLAENNDSLAEVGSYDVSKNFGFEVVPPTSVRPVECPGFVNRKRKWCSVQLFVKGCKEMEKELHIQKFWDKFRWKFFSRKWYTESLEEGGCLSDNLKRALSDHEEQFQKTFPGVAVHDFLTGNTDCHLGNFSFREETIDDALFNSNEGFTIVKYDGGSALPRRHPASGFKLSLSHLIETRMTYLFEVLPQMKKEFSDEIKTLLQDSDRTAYETMATIAIQNLVNVTTASDFHNVWNDRLGRTTFKKWLFEGDPKNEKRMRSELVSRLLGENYPNNRDRAWQYWHYDSHLKRIKGIIDTFKDRYCALIAHLQEKTIDEPPVLKEKAAAVSNKSMRALFGVKRDGDFNAFDEGHTMNPNFTARMEVFQNCLRRWTQDPVKEDIKRQEDYTELQQMPEMLMRDLG